MFYTFRQNNSGGEFEVNDSVKHYVIIEADSALTLAIASKEIREFLLKNGDR